jgi:hypothetical protein
MANSLATPPAPEMPSPTPVSPNALAAPGAATPQGPQGAPGGVTVPKVPAPTHEQTVAALRHYQAIQDELEPLLKDPDLGKTDLRKKAIEGATKLVAARIFSPADAVGQLVDFPDAPQEQKKWIIQKWFISHVAMLQVLDHHGAAVSAGMVPATGKPDRDRHMDDMRGVAEHYKPGQTVH